MIVTEAIRYNQFTSQLLQKSHNNRRLPFNIDMLYHNISCN